MTYRQAVEPVAARAVAGCALLWAAHQSGRLSAAQLVDNAAVVIGAMNSRAAMVADIALARDMQRLTGRSTAPLGLSPGDERARLRKAVATVLARDEPGSLRLVANAEPRAAAQNAYAEGLRARQVRGWRRQVSTAACEKCQRLAGATISSDVTMWHHPGCGCEQEPVLEGS